MKKIIFVLICSVVFTLLVFVNSKDGELYPNFTENFEGVPMAILWNTSLIGSRSQVEGDFVLPDGVYKVVKIFSSSIVIETDTPNGKFAYFIGQSIPCLLDVGDIFRIQRNKIIEIRKFKRNQSFF